jgi:hypothetical protein
MRNSFRLMLTMSYRRWRSDVSVVIVFKTSRCTLLHQFYTIWKRRNIFNLSHLIQDLIQNKYVKKKAPKVLGKEVHFLCPPILNNVTVIVNVRYVRSF